MESSAPSLLLSQGSVDGLGREPPQAARYPAGRCQQPGSLPPWRWHRHPDPEKCKMGGKLTSCGTKDRESRRKKRWKLRRPQGKQGKEAQDAANKPEDKEGEKDTETQAAKEDGPTAEPKQMEVRRSGGHPRGLGGARPSKLLGSGGRARRPQPGPISFQTQNPAAPGLPRPPGRLRRAQRPSSTPRPWQLSLIKR